MPLDIMYFIPEWDDLVSTNYDFWNDTKTEQSKQVYAHDIYGKPNYDGILISKAKIDQSKSKVAKILDIGIHNYLRFEGPVFGDCGAWGYAKEEIPPYKTVDIAKYYQNVGVNYGVSIDHLCIKDTDVNRKRLDITKKNSAEFYNHYHSKSYDFIPVGAVQGWDLESYRESLKDSIDIGYKHIAIGGIARKQSTVIIRLLKGMQDLIQGKDLWLHLFGVSRLAYIREFHKLGIRSFDSASVLRNAWLGSNKNYFNKYFNGYTAIRIPFTTRASSSRFKPFLKSGFYSKDDLEFHEHILYSSLRRFEFENKISAEEVVELFRIFSNQFDENPVDYSEVYLRTLRDRPWEKCDCVICKEIGMDVVIFRGNNRNRRRGFHNTYVFYKLLKRIREDPDFDFIEYQKSDPQYTENIGSIKRVKKPLNKNNTIFNKPQTDENVKQEALDSYFS